MVPEAYKEKQWVKDLSNTADPTTEFFKQFENAQSLIGSRQGIQVPGPEATPEQIKAFHKSLGVPEDIKSYGVKPIEWAPEQKTLGETLTKSRPEGFMNELKQAAMEAGVTPKQFQTMLEAHDKSAVKHLSTQLEVQHQAELAKDAQFEKLLDQKYGEKKAQIIDRGSKLLKATSDPQEQLYLNSLSPEALMVLASRLNTVYEKYVKEDSFPTGAGTSSPTASGMAARRELLALMQSEAYRSEMHPDHDKVVAKVKAGYAALPEEAQNRQISYLS